MTELQKKEQRAIKYLKTFEPQTEPYYLCYSGGKDSDCIRILAELAGVKADIVHNHTTVDAPETVNYVRSIPNIKIYYPDLTMWQLIVKKKTPPTRLARYCCEALKERGGQGRIKITGVRWDESRARKDNSDVVKIIGKPAYVKKTAEELNVNFQLTNKGGVVLNTDNSESRRFLEMCYRTTSTMVNPIVDWLNSDVWQFLNYYGCKSNPLYEQGFCRIGCVGCPLSGFVNQKREFARYPKYKEIYIKTFDRMIEARKASNLPAVWNSGEECFCWWIGENPNQMNIFDMEQL